MRPGGAKLFCKTAKIKLTQIRTSGSSQSVIAVFWVWSAIQSWPLVQL